MTTKRHKTAHLLEGIPQAPPDSILGLTDAFKADPNPSKINLSVGIFQDEHGRSPVLESVKQAEARILEHQLSKTYLPISGDPRYGNRVAELVFGPELAGTGRVATIHTPGGTGALRVAADFIRQLLGKRRIWMSQPTWPNHPGIFNAAGLESADYPYFDPIRNTVDFKGLREGLSQAAEGDIVLIHGCCHNPSGADLTEDQWSELAVLLRERALLPVIDFAYQGFGDNLEQDARGLRILAQADLDLLVCSSFSKNFGLYCERVGALSAWSANPDAGGRILSQLKGIARTNYSNPPAHGGAIVTAILEDADLKALWQSELSGMQRRIAGMRQKFVEGLRQAGATRNFSFLEHQKGMFSFSGLTREQVEQLRSEYAIYIVGSGRINVAGITPHNLKPLCQAIASVL